MNDKPTVDVVVKRSERNAKAVNKRMFEKQISSKEVAEALFREIQRASKVISRQERAENRALKEIWGNQMSAVKAAGKLGSKFDKSLLIFFPDNIFNFSCSSSPKISKEKLLLVFLSLEDFFSRSGYMF